MTTIGLAIHELVTNALKYGALSQPSGQIMVEWNVLSEDSGQQLQVQWREVDGPPVMPPSRTGFGSRLIERMFKGDLGGDAILDYLPDAVSSAARPTVKHAGALSLRLDYLTRSCPAARYRRPSGLIGPLSELLSSNLDRSIELRSICVKGARSSEGSHHPRKSGFAIKEAGTHLN